MPEDYTNKENINDTTEQETSEKTIDKQLPEENSNNEPSVNNNDSKNDEASLEGAVVNESLQSNNLIDSAGNETEISENSEVSENNINAAQLSSEETAAEDKVNRKNGKNKNIIRYVILAAVAIIAVLLVTKFLLPSMNYSAGEKAFETADYELAEQKYTAAGDYKDAAEKAVLSSKAAHYQKAEALVAEEKYADAKTEYDMAEDYQDASAKAIEAGKAAHYQNAEALLEEKKLLDAAKEYELAGDYKDAGEKAAETARAGHYEQAESYMANKDYEAAITEYEASNGYESAADKIKECGYQAGVVKLDAGEYEAAIALLEKAQGYDGAGEKLDEANYLQGEKLFLAGDYAKASEYLDAAGEYGFAYSLSNAAQGELSLADDDLGSAVEYYQNVSDGCVIEGFDVQGRRNAIMNLSNFAAISGTWRATSNYIEVKNIWNYDGSWDSWYIDETDSGQKLKIECKLNDDNTVTVKGKVSFYKFSDYSTLAKYCNAHMTTKSFEWEDATSIPASTDLDSYTTLKYSNGAFYLSYSERDDYSVNFHNVYSSSVTYGSKD